MRIDVMNGLSRMSPLNDYHRNMDYGRTDPMNDHRDYIDYSEYDPTGPYGMDGHEDTYDDEEGEEMQWTNGEVMDGLSRIEVMDDQELSEELGKLRIRFGSGKGKAKRKQRRHLRRQAKALKKEERKQKRHEKRTRRKAKRKEAIKKFAGFVKDVAGALGGRRQPDEETSARLEEEGEVFARVEESWWKKAGLWGINNTTLVIGSGVLVVGTSLVEEFDLC